MTTAQGIILVSQIVTLIALVIGIVCLFIAVRALRSLCR